MSQANIVSTMVKQHRNLQKRMAIIFKLLENGSNFKKINTELRDLFNDFKAHLKLENEIFYIDLIKQMAKRGQDTKKTQQFIDEMREIEKVVLNFGHKYASEESIKDNPSTFKKELGFIVEALSLRIESEEAGVYSYWGLF